MLFRAPGGLPTAHVPGGEEQCPHPSPATSLGLLGTPLPAGSSRVKGAGERVQVLLPSTLSTVFLLHHVEGRGCSTTTFPLHSHRSLSGWRLDSSCGSLTGSCSLAQGCMRHESTAQGNTWPQGIGHITLQWAEASFKIFLH